MEQIELINNYENLELQIKKEQAEYKVDLSQKFVNDVNEFTELCFMLPKNKKENFITREKVKLNLYKLIRSQKKFKDPKNIFGEIRYLAVFDQDTDEIGKLINIDFINQTAEYMTYFDKLNNSITRTKSWKNIYLFDYNSQQLEAMYHHYHASHPRELNYIEMANFLELKEFKKNIVNRAEKIVFDNKEFGIELENAELVV